MTTFLRTSERRDFKRCPQRWWWSWREGLRRQGPPSDALWFGTGIHLALAEWYLPGLKRGLHPAKTWDKWVEEEVRFLRSQPFAGAEYKYEVYIEAGELGREMLENYVDVYGKDSNWKVLAPEQTFQVQIPSLAPSIEPITYAGTFDLVFRDRETNKIWLGEHKTAKAIQTNHLPLDDQGGSYWAVATKTLRAQRIIGAKERLEGVMYNFLRKGVPDPRPTNEAGLSLNKDGSVSKQQPAPLLKREAVYRTRGELRSQVQRIQGESVAMNVMRDGTVPLYKNPTRDCAWDCSFYEMCLLHEGGDDWEEFRDAMYKVEDPYRDHRKSASGVE